MNKVITKSRVIMAGGAIVMVSLGAVVWLNHADRTSFLKSNFGASGLIDNKSNHLELDSGRMQSVTEATDSNNREKWIDEFPWSPTHDPAYDVARIKKILNAKRDFREIIDNHQILTLFFNDRYRFSPQFEQTYRVLEKHDLGQNPILAIKLFNPLRHYAETSERSPDQMLSEDGLFYYFVARKGEQDYSLGLIEWYIINDSGWLYNADTSEEYRKKARAIARELIASVTNMLDLPRDVMDYVQLRYRITQIPDEAQLLSGQKRFLVPYEGWFDKKYDEINKSISEVDLIEMLGLNLDDNSGDDTNQVFE